ncbi:MAG: hypothetical protein CMP53_09180 [Flavobacteriales bacterium]|nr:hypothetical protein [Flavobacteriales bacterium]|tara:strand:- start:61 stop:699 length:639 start_codon:yes stop_codon:yes gene_type:complete
MRQVASGIFDEFSFSSVPFIGIGDANRLNTLEHPYLQQVPEGVNYINTPWGSSESTMIGLSKNDVTFAAISLDDNVRYLKKSTLNPFESRLNKVSMNEYHLEVYSKSDSLIPKEYAFEAFPQIFSAIPLDITYSLLIDQLVTNVPKTKGGALYMEGNSNRMMHGQIFVPAGEIVDLGPILKMIRRKESAEYPKDNHLITRHVHLCIRKRLYG